MTKNTRTFICILTFGMLTIISSCSGNEDRYPEFSAHGETSKLMVFAAVSLTDVLTELKDSFEAAYPVKVQLNLASSGTLARQIEQGGEADVYISANRKWASYIDSLGFIEKEYLREIARNELVLVAPSGMALKTATIDSTLDLMALLAGDRLSMGDPAHVPAGRYAHQALQYYGWEGLTSRILPAKDVRSALMVVEMGEVPLGIVYRTDALKSKKVQILDAFPEKSHQPIVYMAGVCKLTAASVDFYAFLNAAESFPVWEKYGFKK